MTILCTLYLYVYRCLNLLVTFLERIRGAIEREQRKLLILLSKEQDGGIATQTPEMGMDECTGNRGGNNSDPQDRCCQITSSMIPLYSRSEEVGYSVLLYSLDLEFGSSVSVPGIIRERVLLLVRIRDGPVHFAGELLPSSETTATDAVGL